MGNSHVLALFQGFEEIHAALPENVELTFIARGRYKIGYAAGSAAGYTVSSPAGTLADLMAGANPTHVFVVWQGNQVNVRALLLLDGPPFDVVLPEDGERALDPDVQLIPTSAVRAHVRASLEDAELTELLVRAAGLGARAWLIGPPPPLPEAAVRERLNQEAHFADRLVATGLDAAGVAIVPEAVRVRLRALLLEAYRDFAVERGVGFCPPPASVADEAGLLLRRCWGRDITHGNGAYGAAYLERIVATALAPDA